VEWGGRAIALLCAAFWAVARYDKFYNSDGKEQQKWMRLRLDLERLGEDKDNNHSECQETRNARQTEEIIISPILSV